MKKSYKSKTISGILSKGLGTEFFACSYFIGDQQFYGFSETERIKINVDYGDIKRLEKDKFTKKYPDRYYLKLGTKRLKIF